MLAVQNRSSTARGGFTAGRLTSRHCGFHPDPQNKRRADAEGTAQLLRVTDHVILGPVF